MPKVTKWTGASNGDWDDASRWSAGVPTADSVAIIDVAPATNAQPGDADPVTVIKAKHSLTASGLEILSDTELEIVGVKSHAHISGKTIIKGGVLNVQSMGNTFGGGIKLDGAQLWVQHNGAIGDTAIALSNGSSYNATGNAEIGNHLTINGVNSLTDTKASGTVAVTGAVTWGMSSELQCGAAGNTVQWNPTTVRGSGQLACAGDTLVLTSSKSVKNDTIALNNAALAFNNAKPQTFQANLSVENSATFAVSAGVALALPTFAGKFVITATTNIDFKSAALKADATTQSEPSFNLNFSSFDSGGNSYNLGVTTCAIKSTIHNETAFDSFLNGAATVNLDNGGILNLTGQDGITLHRLFGTGEVLNTGAHESLNIDITQSPGFSGLIKGDLDITASVAAILTGSTIALAAGDVIHIAGAFSSLDLGGVHFQGPVPTIDMGTGQNTELIVDHNFKGTIENLVSGDSFAIADETYAAVTPVFKENAQNTGGELTIKIGTQPEIVLELKGVFQSDDFFVSNTAGGRPFIEYAPSEEHLSQYIPPGHVDFAI